MIWFLYNGNVRFKLVNLVKPNLYFYTSLRSETLKVACRVKTNTT